MTVNRVLIQSKRYADDTVLLANNIDDLQLLVNKVSEEYGLSFNTKKTKYMIISKTAHNNEQIYVNDQRIEKVDRYRYSGAQLLTTVTMTWGK